jgi:hypothetical protein
MPKSAIEDRLAKAFAGLNPELRRMILPAFEADLASSAPRQLRLIHPGPSADLRQATDQLRQLAEIAPHELKELRQEIDRRLLLAQRALAAHIDYSSRKPWPWPLYYAVRKAPDTSAAAQILLAVLDVTPADVPDIIKFAGIIRSVDQRAARILLSYLLAEYVPLSAAARFEGQG